MMGVLDRWSDKIFEVKPNVEEFIEGNPVLAENIDTVLSRVVEEFPDGKLGLSVTHVSSEEFPQGFAYLVVCVRLPFYTPQTYEKFNNLRAEFAGLLGAPLVFVTTDNVPLTG